MLGVCVCVLYVYSFTVMCMSVLPVCVHNMPGKVRSEDGNPWNWSHTDDCVWTKTWVLCESNS